MAHGSKDKDDLWPKQKALSSHPWHQCSSRHRSSHWNPRAGRMEASRSLALLTNKISEFQDQ